MFQAEQNEKVEYKMLGVPIKYLALALLVCQNSANVLLIRYTRNVDGELLFHH